MPHIFGSAAYIQDQLAGLGPPEVQERASKVEQSVSSTASKHVHNAALTNATHTCSTSSAQETKEQADMGKPRNFKAMLEAALSAKSASQLDAFSTGVAGQDLPSGEVASSYGGPSKSWLKNSKQLSNEDPTSADQPHVLAWLEQGRGLFDDDEE